VRYDNRFGYFGACYMTNDNGGDSGGTGGEGGKPNDAPKDPPWKREFGDEFDPDKAWSLIQNQRRNERQLTTAKEAAEAKVAEFENASKTELEKATAKIAELEAKVAEANSREAMRAISGEVADTAKRMGAVYPDDVYALVSGKLEIKDGKATNIEDVVKELATSRPMLFQASNIDQRKTNQTQQTGEGNAGMNAMIRTGLGRG